MSEEAYAATATWGSRAQAQNPGRQPEEEAREVCLAALSQLLGVVGGIRGACTEEQKALEAEAQVAKAGLARAEGAVEQLRQEAQAEKVAAVQQAEARAEKVVRGYAATADRAERTAAEAANAIKAMLSEEIGTSLSVVQAEHAATLEALTSAFDARLGETEAANAAQLDNVEAVWASRHDDAKKQAMHAGDSLKALRRRHLVETAHTYDALSATNRARAQLMEQAMALIAQAQEEDPSRHLGMTPALMAAVGGGDDDMPSPSAIRATYAKPAGSRSRA